MRIGVAGLGRMGRIMAGRLVDAGLDVVVWNRSPAATAGFAAVAASPGALAREADVVLTVVSGAPANAALYEALAAQGAGTLLVNLSTLSPAVAVALAAVARGGGQRYLDAPVLGSVQPAAEGRLVALAGGAAEDVEAARPALEALARRIVHVGAVGAGSSMKIVHNTVLSLYWAALGEAFSFGERAGLDRAAMVAVLADSPAANGQFSAKAPVLRGEPAPVGYDLASLAGELAANEAVFAGLGVDPALIRLARETAQRAVAAGWGARDIAELSLFRG